MLWTSFENHDLISASSVKLCPVHVLGVIQNNLALGASNMHNMQVQFKLGARSRPDINPAFHMQHRL